MEAGTASFAPPEFFGTFDPVRDGMIDSLACSHRSQETLIDLAFPDDTEIVCNVITQNQYRNIAVLSSGCGDGLSVSQ